ncbi:hypothetical protein L3X38_003547 [Prunus dulcis]|uniref:DUF4218 domain-containing protein n=1 Tax=Prunus dulcis TaxID=3755 RepID=A0AAD5F230_PRUDU|nr:hypothetical protein L3X38_003547 [Prunus dulcis]
MATRQYAAFNGKPEYGTPPKPLTGEEVLHMVEDFNYIWGLKNGESVGCIAEQYIVEEAVEFCTENLSDVVTVGAPSSQKIGSFEAIIRLHNKLKYSGSPTLYRGTYDPHQDHLSKI